MTASMFIPLCMYIHFHFVSCQSCRLCLGLRLEDTISCFYPDFQHLKESLNCTQRWLSAVSVVWPWHFRDYSVVWNWKVIRRGWNAQEGAGRVRVDTSWQLICFSGYCYSPSAASTKPLLPQEPVRCDAAVRHLMKILVHMSSVADQLTANVTSFWSFRKQKGKKTTLFFPLKFESVFSDWNFERRAMIWRRSL